MKRPLACAVMDAPAIPAAASVLLPSNRAERSPPPIPLANAAFGATDRPPQIFLVMAANAGIQYTFDKALDSRLRGNGNIAGYDSI
jgi:hypothetical protein